jgi:hypothetical protein
MISRYIIACQSTEQQSKHRNGKTDEMQISLWITIKYLQLMTFCLWLNDVVPFKEAAPNPDELFSPAIITSILSIMVLAD